MEHMPIYLEARQRWRLLAAAYGEAGTSVAGMLIWTADSMIAARSVRSTSCDEPAWDCWMRTIRAHGAGCLGL